MLKTKGNRKNEVIRIDERTKEAIKNGDPNALRLIRQEDYKFPQGFMVSGGVSAKGVGKLIFVVGTMNTFAYSKALDFYKEDISRLDETLLFQQDNAPPHVSSSSIEKVNTMNPLPYWPPNSPDISPIETIWAILEEQLDKVRSTIKTLDDLKEKLLFFWNRIPVSLCRSLCLRFNTLIKELHKNNGGVINENSYSKEKKQPLDFSIQWNNNDVIERIVYNEKTITLVKKKKIALLTNESKELYRKIQEEKMKIEAEADVKGIPIEIKEISRQEHQEVIDNCLRQRKAIKIRKRELKNMDIKMFYDNLVEVNEVKKLINFRVTRNIDADTTIQTNEDANEEEYEDSVLNNSNKKHKLSSNIAEQSDTISSLSIEEGI